MSSEGAANRTRTEDSARPRWRRRILMRLHTLRLAVVMPKAVEIDPDGSVRVGLLCLRSLANRRSSSSTSPVGPWGSLLRTTSGTPQQSPSRASARVSSATGTQLDKTSVWILAMVPALLVMNWGLSLVTAGIWSNEARIRRESAGQWHSGPPARGRLRDGNPRCGRAARGVAAGLVPGHIPARPPELALLLADDRDPASRDPRPPAEAQCRPAAGSRIIARDLGAGPSGPSRQARKLGKGMRPRSGSPASAWAEFAGDRRPSL